MALKSSGARAQKRNKTKSLFKFKSRGHTGVIIRCRGRRLFKAVNTRAHATVDVVIDVCGCVVTPTPYVRDIGVWLDSAMSMAKNVSRVCQMAYCQLRSIARIRRSITTAACRTIVHALVMSRLDYCKVRFPWGLTRRG